MTHDDGTGRKDILHMYVGRPQMSLLKESDWLLCARSQAAWLIACLEPGTPEVRDTLCDCRRVSRKDGDAPYSNGAASDGPLWLMPRYAELGSLH